jgi:hypothetical protein
MDALTKEKNKLEKELEKMIKTNKDEESGMRAKYINRAQDLANNVIAYDGEITTAEETKAKMETDYKDSAHDL